jgi:hypothetical protein
MHGADDDDHRGRVPRPVAATGRVGDPAIALSLARPPASAAPGGSGRTPPP